MSCAAWVRSPREAALNADALLLAVQADRVGEHRRAEGRGIAARRLVRTTFEPREQFDIRRLQAGPDQLDLLRVVVAERGGGGLRQPRGHADAQGAYDNQGYRLRGHQFSDARGRYVFDTITPGVYPGRTRHYHVKAQAPGGRVLTTQLYFPDESANRRDGIFDRRLLMRVEAASDGNVGRFDFVLNLA